MKLTIIVFYLVILVNLSALAGDVVSAEVPRMQIHSGPAVQAPNKPPQKVIFEDVCPFEGCILGTWRASTAIKIYQSPDTQSPRVATVAAGQCVQAVRSEVHTVSPGRFVFDDAANSLCGWQITGTVHFVYAYIGEGFYQTWSNGMWHMASIGYMPEEKNGRWEKNVCGTFDPTPINEWWVLVDTGNGVQGWTNKGKAFEGNYGYDPYYPVFNKDCTIDKSRGSQADDDWGNYWQ